MVMRLFSIDNIIYYNIIIFRIRTIILSYDLLVYYFQFLKEFPNHGNPLNIGGKNRN